MMRMAMRMRRFDDVRMQQMMGIRRDATAMIWMRMKLVVAMMPMDKDEDGEFLSQTRAGRDDMMMIS